MDCLIIYQKVDVVIAKVISRNSVNPGQDVLLPRSCKRPPRFLQSVDGESVEKPGHQSLDIGAEMETDRTFHDLLLPSLNGEKKQTNSFKLNLGFKSSSSGTELENWPGVINLTLDLGCKHSTIQDRMCGHLEQRQLVRLLHRTIDGRPGWQKDQRRYVC